MTLPADAYFAEIITSTETLAEVTDGADLTRPVPTCPEWTLRQLATHVGRGQRWAAEIVSTGSRVSIPFRAVPDGRFPDQASARADWLRAGAARLVEVLRSADGTEVWAFGTLAPPGFWARRMAQETAVHRADAQIAAGIRPDIDPAIAADGIDEWLDFLTGPAQGETDPRLAALAGGRSLHLHTTGTAPAGEWMVSAAGGAVSVTRGHGRGDAALRGPAGALLLVLTRRLPPDDPAVEVIGDRALLASWLAATPF